MTGVSPHEVAGSSLRAPRKSLDNPARDKWCTPRDAALGECVAAVLGEVPATLDARPGEVFPLVAAVLRDRRSARRGVGRSLLCLAALIHEDADERRVAEYLLHRRAAVLDGERSPADLVRAARRAMDCDARARQRREQPVEEWVFTQRADGGTVSRQADPSVAETVLDFLTRVLDPAVVGEHARDRITTGVLVAVELAEQHTLNGGRIPAVIAMRPAARKQARLVTHLRREFGDPLTARHVARLLVGADGSSIETSLLWWVVQPGRGPGDVPGRVRGCWARDATAAGTARP